MVNLKMFLEAEMHRKETCSLGSGKKMDRDNVDTHVRTHTHAHLPTSISKGKIKYYSLSPKMLTHSGIYKGERKSPDEGSGGRTGNQGLNG